MPDTADTIEAAGQPDEDAAAQQALADAMTPPEPNEGQEQGREQTRTDPWADPDVARREIEKLRRESAGYRTRLRDAEPRLAQYQEYLDSQKTEQERLADAKSAAEARLAEVMATNARLMAAATHNIPAELIDLLGTGTDEEITARAQLLAERLTAATVTAPATERPASTRPVESLTAGGRPADDTPPLDMDAYLRRMAGRG